MRITGLVAALAILAVPAVAAAQQHDHAGHTMPKASGEVGEVRAVVLAHAAAVERGDLAALDSLWSQGPDVMIVEGAGADIGWKSYREHHLKPELAAFEDLRYRFENVKVTVEGHVAWASFDYKLQGQLDEHNVDVVGKGTMVLRHDPSGAWRIVHSHTSGKSNAK